MTKKDYIAIADILQTFTGIEPERGDAERIATEVADYCEKENPLFDRERFLSACGVS